MFDTIEESSLKQDIATTLYKYGVVKTVTVENKFPYDYKLTPIKDEDIIPCYDITLTLNDTFNDYTETDDTYQLEDLMFESISESDYFEIGSNYYFYVNDEDS